MKLNISFPATSHQKLIEVDEEKNVPELTETFVPGWLVPRRATRSQNVSNSLKEMISTNLLSEISFKKKHRTKAPIVQCLKQHTNKNKEEAAEYAKLSLKRMNGVNENCQEQIAKRHRLSSSLTLIKQTKKEF
ncbi:hypothetical protein A6R68_07780, partial [Neotoma lepida]